ncbi:AAA family ATPase [Vibrio ziniensis]|uniref:ATP-binding protein n=1 Tax=Vibrio ziniensis TaxID=2711221 RepID=A0A6G7CHM1_9VIBR|nr:AAA family ATPase [Vibrio ziniensis]QIH41589.1 ATP-binding protein [Vibrio ziniensis]
MLTLTLIRGLPGSGKSTLAKTLNGVHLEADMYFVNEQGEYLYRPEAIGEAHQWCQSQADYWLHQRENVVVSNTFVKLWEMSAYKKLAKKYKAKLKIIVCRESYGNIHGVGEDVIERMRKDWQE